MSRLSHAHQNLPTVTRTATPALGLALITILALSLAACEGDDLAPAFSEEQLLGSWTLWRDEQTYDTEIVGVTIPASDVLISGSATWTFDADGTLHELGTVVRSHTVYPGTDSAAREIDTFELDHLAAYRVEDDVIIVTDDFYGKEGFFGESDLDAPTTVAYAVSDFQAGFRIDLDGVFDFTVPFFGQELRFNGTSTSVLTR